MSTGAGATKMPRAVVDGRLEAVSDGRVRGWAWTIGDPAQRLRILVAVDGEQVADTVAELHWPRLEAAGVGDGAHGFEVSLPPSLGDGRSHAVCVRAGPDGAPLRPALGFSVDATPGGTFAGTEFGVLQPPREHDSSARPSALHSSAGLPALRSFAWSSYRPRAATAPRWLLAGACVAYFLFGAYLTRHFSFFQDDYAIFLEHRGWSAAALLTPINQHLLVTYLLVAKLLWATVGLSTFWPYQLPVLAAHVVLVLAIYVLASRRSGPWLALVPAGLMLVVFPGWEDMLWGLNVSIIVPLAAGAWALVCLERGDRRGDVSACVLLLLSVTTFSVGLFIPVTIGVWFAITDRRRLWVAAVPVALYALWYSQYGQSDIVWSNLPNVPSYDLHIAGYGFAGLVGMSSSVYGSKALIVGYVLLAAAVAWLVGQGIRRRLSTLTMIGVVAALMFWTATALARAAYGEPDASRYLYDSAAYMLMALAGVALPRTLSSRTAIAIGLWALITLAHAVVGEPSGATYPALSAVLLVLAMAATALPGQVTRPAAIAVATAGVAIVAVGLPLMSGYASFRTTVDALVRVQLGAVQIAEPVRNPDYVIDAHYMGGITAGDWQSIVRDLGSNAFTAAKIESMPAWYRSRADTALIGAEAIVPRAVATVPPGAACSPVPTAPAPLMVSAAPGSTAYITSARGSRIDVWMRRLSSDFAAQPQLALRPGASARIALPRDQSSLPWELELMDANGRIAPTRAGRAADSGAKLCVVGAPGSSPA